MSDPRSEYPTSQLYVAVSVSFDISITPLSKLTGLSHSRSTFYTLKQSFITPNDQKSMNYLNLHQMYPSWLHYKLFSSIDYKDTDRSSFASLRKKVISFTTNTECVFFFTMKESLKVYGGI